jgi:hypothetical protein
LSILQVCMEGLRNACDDLNKAQPSTTKGFIIKE